VTVVRTDLPVLDGIQLLVDRRGCPCQSVEQRKFMISMLSSQILLSRFNQPTTDNSNDDISMQTAIKEYEH